jgi:hypothetical protein
MSTNVLTSVNPAAIQIIEEYALAASSGCEFSVTFSYTSFSMVCECRHVPLGQHYDGSHIPSVLGGDFLFFHSESAAQSHLLFCYSRSCHGYSSSRSGRLPFGRFLPVTLCLLSPDKIAQIHSLRHPFAPVTVSGVVGAMVLNSLPTYIIDIALLFRVIAVYPPHSVSRFNFILIIALPVLLKILRVVEWIAWSVGAAHRASTIGQAPGYVNNSLQHRWAIARVAMTVVDNRCARPFVTPRTYKAD